MTSTGESRRTKHFPGEVVRGDIAAIVSACASELETLSGQVVLITGGTGFVGCYLAETIAAWNATAARPCRLLLPVRSLARARARWPHLADAPGLEWIPWGPGADLHKAVTASAAWIIHGAASADPAVYMRQPRETLLETLDLTRQVIAYAEAAGSRRLLYLSSGAVYGPQPPEVAGFPETYLGGPDLTQPRSCYAEAKRYCELLCQTAPVGAVVARIFAVLGPYQDLHSSFAIPDFIAQAATSGRVRLISDGGDLRTFCYATDLSIGLWKLLLLAPAGTVCNVGAENPVLSIRQAADGVAARFGGIPVDVPVPPRVGPVSRYTPDCTLLRRFHIPRIDFYEGLDRVLASLREREPDPSRWV